MSEAEFIIKIQSKMMSVLFGPETKVFMHKGYRLAESWFDVSKQSGF